MPFGLANKGSVYSRILDVAMKVVDRDFWMSYLDDILTISREPWAHFAHFGHLSQVVRAHVATGIKIQPCMTKLFQSEVEYLGHKISKGRVSMIPEYLQKIKDWPSTEEWHGGSYVPRIPRILSYLHPTVLCID